MDRIWINYISDMTHNVRNVPSDMYAQRKFRSACALVQADQNLHLAKIWIAKNAKFFHMSNEDSHETARMCRLV